MSIPHRILSGIVDFVITGAGSGLSPVSPGTIGSLAAVLFWILLVSTGAIASSTDTLLFAVGISVLGTIATHHHLKRKPEVKDPGYIVIDEWAGMFLGLAGVTGDLASILIAFGLFRLLDISKPLLVGRAEKMPGALGVMLDDIVAGILTGVIMSALGYIL